MQYLLDTHVVLWWLLDPQKIHKKARDIISDRQQDLFVSSISFWEISIKSNIGRLTIPRNIIELLSQESIQLLSMTAEDGLAVSDLPPLHKDPFDRMLVVQAKRNDLIIMTRDSKITKYPVVTLKA
jgi:PIN domain nuclease of toxin-antitoxin system